MKRYFLVDMENVHFNGLLGIGSLTENDTIILFLTSQCKKDYGMIDLYKSKYKCNILTMDVECGGKNALDFQLVSYLGLIIGDNKNQGEYYIVSKDKGFKSSINLLSNCSKCRLKLIPFIGALSKHYKESCMENIIKILNKQFSKKKTSFSITAILMTCDNKYEAINKIETKYGINNLIKCEDVLNMYFGKNETDKDLKVLSSLEKFITHKTTCYKILNIMKLSNDINLVLDMLESLLLGLNDWRDRIQESLQVYYG
ncbi:MAG: PIN domain-containing protein [Terrisporobacter othiniensis]|nr:PIN domain-containing protein [Terrisporobacter othiniensis]